MSRSRRTTIVIPSEDERALRAASRAEGVSQSEIIGVTDRGRVVARLSGVLRDGEARQAGGAALLLRLARERRPG